ncbi:MAG: hypothetical protein QUS33_12350 [Dehalococcoidia bacterium]|nr:hypothetical protein [Dehalococcoidia bacterium]
MSEGPVLEEPRADWRSDPELRQVEVVVCTTGGTFVGHAYRTSRLRLLDALNKGFAVHGTLIATDYIPMTEVQLYLPDGSQHGMASAHIRKASVFFVAERKGGQPEGGTSKVGKVIVAKKPVDVTLCTLGHVLDGSLHSAAWAQLVTSLYHKETFVPLTNVKIRPPLANGEGQFEFVAVNNDKVIYVGEPKE